MGYIRVVLHVYVSLNLGRSVVRLGIGTFLQRILAGTIQPLTNHLTGETVHRLPLFGRIALANHWLFGLDHRRLAHGCCFSLTRT